MEQKLIDEQFREMIDKVKAMEDELLRLTTPKNGLYDNFKRIVHLRKLINSLKKARQRND